jgi:hypothetical protein
LFNFGPQALSAAWDIGNGIWDGITGVISGIPDFLGNILNQVIEKLGNLKDNVFSAAKEFAGGMWDGFKSGLGINSPSYIEEALFAIDDQVQSSTGNLATQIRKMQGLSRSMPTLNTGAVGLPSSTQTAIDSGGGAGVYNQNAPLIGQASIRSDQDIVNLARELDRLRSKQARARGQKMVNA